jgi:putative ABC transport system permease protein
MQAFLHTVVARLSGFLRPRQSESEFDQELDAHLAMAVEEKIQRGMSPEQARRTARLELGGLAQLRDAARGARGLPWLAGFGLDIKLGLRMLRKSWGLTLVGGFAMTVTIGLGASVLTIWNALGGTMLPLDEGHRIVAIQRFDAATTGNRTTPLPDFERWRDVLRSVTDVSAMRRSERNVIAPDGSPRQVSVAEMTASGFRVARVRPLLGRPLVEDDERDGADLVAVIGHEVWQSGFSSDPAVLGRRLQLDEAFYTVVGVMPSEFAFPVNDRIWTALRNDQPVTASGTREAFVFARLAPGVTIEGSRAEVATVGMLPPLLPSAAAEPAEHLPPRVVPYAAGLFDGADASRWVGGVILFLVVLLLVPPCANIGILVYARTVTRQAEFAARYALGASRSRIVVQIFIEVLVLSVAAGIAGFLLARQFAGQLSSIVTPGLGPQNLPFWMDFTPSFGTVLCVAGLTVLAAAIAGGVPALHVTGRWRQSGLHVLGNAGTGGRLGKTWTALLTTQVALSLAILPSAMEMKWGIFRPSILGPGFAIDEFLTAQIAMAGDTSRFGSVQAEMVRRLRASAGVSGVTVSATALMEESQPRIEVEGGGSARSDVAVNHVDDAFFGVFDARFMAGRGFEGGDFAPGQTAVIVNRSFVEEAVGAGNPLGRRVRYSRTNDRDTTSDPSGWFEIVGVVDDFIANDNMATMYHPLAPGQHHPVSVALRVGSNAALVSGELREIAGALDPTLRVGRLRSLGDIYRQRRSAITMFGLVLVTVMVIVLLFTMAGNYALMAFTVAQRWREIGLRSALGAQPRRLVAEIFGRALVPLVTGAVVGGLLGLLIDSNVETAQVGGRSIPGLVPACAALMIAVGLLALIAPARRAVRVDPAEALRDV